MWNCFAPRVHIRRLPCIKKCLLSGQYLHQIGSRVNHHVSGNRKHDYRHHSCTFDPSKRQRVGFLGENEAASWLVGFTLQCLATIYPHPYTKTPNRTSLPIVDEIWHRRGLHGMGPRREPEIKCN
jgi:hypothetical protein